MVIKLDRGRGFAKVAAVSLVAVSSWFAAAFVAVVVVDMLDTAFVSSLELVSYLNNPYSGD